MTRGERQYELTFRDRPMMILTLLMDFSTFLSLQGRMPSSGFQQSIPHLLMVMLGLQSAPTSAPASGRAKRAFDSNLC